MTGDEKEIRRLIEQRGFKTIIIENDLMLWEVLMILDELKYIDLERYKNGEVAGY
jgi:hypothetical protein